MLKKLDSRLSVQFQELLIHFFFLTTFLCNLHPDSSKISGRVRLGFLPPFQHTYIVEIVERNGDSFWRGHSRADRESTASVAVQVQCTHAKPKAS